MSASHRQSSSLPLRLVLSFRLIRRITFCPCCLFPARGRTAHFPGTACRSYCVCRNRCACWNCTCGNLHKVDRAKNDVVMDMPFVDMALSRHTHAAPLLPRRQAAVRFRAPFDNRLLPAQRTVSSGGLNCCLYPTPALG